MSSGLVLEAEGGRWKQYPAYRDSGVEWLGAVPEGWSAVAVKHHFNIQLGKMLQNKPDSDADILIPYAKALHVLWGSVITDDLPEMWAKPSDIQQYGIRGDDLLVCEGGEVGRAGVVTSPPEQCIIQNALHRVRAKKSSDVQFLGYVLHAVNSSTWFDVLCNKATIAHFTREKCADLRIPVPPLPEQRAIATFLDRETGRIDALIAKKERQIELLQEKRIALISHAVTKGLDPDAPMKNSGVEWLGEIPVGWAAGKTKYVATLRTGHTPSRQHPEYWEDCIIPWFSLADVWQLRDGRQEYLGETKEKISALGLANSSAELLPANTVIVSRTASVGFSGIMPEPMATTQDFVNWVCSPKIQPEYLLYVFRSMEHEFKRLTMGSTHKTIYMPDAASFQTPVPPPGEQKQIVKYVQKHKRSLEHVEDLVAVSIKKLREYRTALISAAVTGKIDVRGELVS